MTNKTFRTIAAFGLLLAATSAPSQERSGYLDPAAFDLLQIVPPAPVKGDQRYATDRRIFKATRKLLATPRGALATRDVRTGSADMLDAYACALGVTLTPERAPKLVALIGKAGADTALQNTRVKNFYKRARPFHQDRGAVCQPVTELADSYDYPSGHTTWGWTWALILTELAPDRATPLLARGRAYGQSRFVCGAHNESAVEAGWLGASATMAAVRQSATFQADVAAARSELATLRNDPTTPRRAGCEAETALVAQRVL